MEMALYDGEGQRVQQIDESNATATTTQHTYVGGTEDLASQWPNAGGAPTTTTAYYGGGMAVSVNGTLSYLLGDGLGSVSESVNTSGTVTATQLYGPYGAVRYASGALPTDYGYTHQRADATSGLDDYGARYYDPVAGQFTSADSTLAGGLNRYAYVGGNPETRTDPSGHMYAQNAHPYYQDFGASVYKLIAQDQGHASNGMSTALFIASYDPDAYRAAEAYGVGHGVVMMPHVGEDANTYVQAVSHAHAAYWNSSSAAMLQFITLKSLSHDVVVANTGVRSGDLNTFTADWRSILSATRRAGPLSQPLAGEGDGGGALFPGCGGQSFTATTLVATPQGERPIASLKVGRQVSAYDPATGKTTTQTIVRMFLNHDSDRLDVTLAVAPPASTPSVPSAQHAGRARPATAGASSQEVIHTTASHPWLTADHGWTHAGTLHIGDAVRLLDGQTATVEALQALPGVGPMWDLSLDATHTFAVGDAQAVVHNCDDTLSSDEIQRGFNHAENELTTQFDTADWKMGNVENNGSPSLNDDPALKGYPSRYYFKVHPPDGPVKLSLDFDPVSRAWNTDLGQGIHLSGDQYNTYWQDESDRWHGW